MGSTIRKKQKNAIRIFFQNVGGLLPENDGDLKLQVLLQFTQQHQIDAFSFVEHNICWDLLPKTQQMAERTRGWWENAHWITSVNKCKQNPIPHQPGGTGIPVFNALSHKALKPGGDKTGLGRWSWVRLQGQSGQVLRILAAYRPRYSIGPLSSHVSTTYTILSIKQLHRLAENNLLVRPHYDNKEMAKRRRSSPSNGRYE